jgi:hypothetical protein
MDAAKLLELVKSKRATIASRGRTIKPEKGVNRYLLLPSWRRDDAHGPKDMFWRDFGQHFIKNMTGALQAIFPCQEAIYEQPCPVCEALANAMKSAPSDETIGVLKNAVAARSFLFNVLALDDTANAATPQILEIRKSVLAQILALYEEWGDEMLGAKKQNVVVINRDGVGLDTTYMVQVSPKKIDVPPRALGMLHDLDDFVRQANDALLNKSLTAINRIAGLPAGVADMMTLEHDEVVVQEPGAARAERSPERPPVRPAAQTTRAADLAQVRPTDDADLDELLADIPF